MAHSYHSYAFKSKHSSTKKQWVFLPTSHNWKVVGIWHVLQKRKKKEKEITSSKLHRATGLMKFSKGFTYMC